MQFGVRPALAQDTEFCRRLYVGSMLPVMASYPGWDAVRLEKNFGDYFRPSCAQIIVTPGRNGWIQVEDDGMELLIGFIYLTPECRGKGIGSFIIRGLVHQAAAQGKTCAIRCVKTNDGALRLYKRLGFRIVSEDNLKYFMESAA